MVTDGLLEWYAREKRDLPWRRDRDPYRVWVSEIMLQQTRVEAVIPYYTRFLEALPDVQALAYAPEDKLLKLWEGLGYYSRVRNMQKAAGQIIKMGGFPRTAKDLRALSGFGDYTAGAVASIAFAHREAAVDGNVLRVWARMERVGESIRMPSVRRACKEAVLNAMPLDADPGDYNQALMELGATVCTPRSPQCGRCPVQENCAAFCADEVGAYPVSEPKSAKREEEFQVFLVVRDGHVLVRQRPKKGMLAGLWEFPHHVDGMKVKECTPIEVWHVFTHRIWTMHGVFADALEEMDGQWVNAAQLAALPMASAMEKFRQSLLESGELTDARAD